MKNFYSTGLRLVSAALIFCAGTDPARADVSVLFSPQPLPTSRAIGISEASVWTVRACNGGDTTVTIAPERVFQAAPGVAFLETGEAQLMLQQSHVHQTRVKIARYLEGAVLMATVLTGGGIIAASSKVIVALSLSTAAAHQIGDMIQKVAPDMGTVSSRLLAMPFTLAPGGCETHLALSDVQPEAKPVNAVIK